MSALLVPCYNLAHGVRSPQQGSQIALECARTSGGQTGVAATPRANPAPSPATRTVETEVVHHAVPERHEPRGGDAIIEAAYGEAFALGHDEGSAREEAALEEVLQNPELYYAEAKDALTDGRWGDTTGRDEVGDSGSDVRVRFDDANQTASVYYGSSDDASAVIHYSA